MSSSTFISAERLSQVARPARRTHVLFQQQVHPLCVAPRPTGDAKIINKCHVKFLWLHICTACTVMGLAGLTCWSHKASHLFLKPCMRCRKAQMELCLALDRRNSAYLLENSRSPSCLLRSRPVDSSCLKPPKTHFWSPITGNVGAL